MQTVRCRTLMNLSLTRRTNTMLTKQQRNEWLKALQYIHGRLNGYREDELLQIHDYIKAQPVQDEDK